MQKPAIPENEAARLTALGEYDVLDTLPEKEYDDITAIAAEICQTPISLVSIVDEKRQWFKSHYGLPETETPREVAFCAHAINRPEELFIIPNSAVDERFKDNPLVTGYPQVAFYAGMPLVNEEGCALGTLCVIDHRPRELSERQIATLKKLGHQVVQVMELRRKMRQLNEARKDLARSNQELERFARVVAHDIKTPLGSLVTMTELLKADYASCLDAQAQACLNMMSESAVSLIDLVNGILAYSKSGSAVTGEMEPINLSELLAQVVGMVAVPPSFQVSYPNDLPTILVHKVALQQILLNLISNAIKYNYQERGRVIISFREESGCYWFSVKDNGAGIPPDQHDRIFELFATLNQPDRFNKKGTGIGLCTVKKLVERLGGQIALQSAVGQGTEFRFSCRKPPGS